MKIAVQLYSLRDIIKGSGENLLAILPRVKALGYDGVEFAGYFGVDAATLRTALDSAGLVAVGTHIAIESYSPENFDETAAFCRTLGMKTMGMGGADHETPEELKATCAELKAADERAAKIGMSVYYHNHCSEFEPISDGVIPFDELKKAAHLEIDTYWSFVAGQDNYKLITENRDRIAQLHVKDGTGHTPKALGEGNCDIPEVVRAAKDIGIEWLIVENDDPVPNGLDDIGRSIKYLKSII